MSTAAKVTASGKGSHALRFTVMLAIAAICSFTLGALCSQSLSQRPLASAHTTVEAGKPSATRFSLRESLSAVRQRVTRLMPYSLKTSTEIASHCTAQETMSMTTANADKRKYIPIFIGIFTAAGDPSKYYEQRREAIRKTWLTKVEEFPEIEARFITGHSTDPAMQASIVAEQNEYHDLIFLDLQDCYTCLPHKTIAFLEMVAATYYAEWVVKMDDDVYLSPHRLRLAAHQWGRMRADYIGCMKHGDVYGDPDNKWYEPAQLLIGHEYHMNAYGSIYVVSARAIRDVVIAGGGNLRLLANEDTSVGLWMSAFNMTFFEDMRLCHPQCHPAGVGFLDNACSGLCNPIQDMYTLHTDPECTRKAKAPLPYMPGFPGHEGFHNMRVL